MKTTSNKIYRMTVIRWISNLTYVLINCVKTIFYAQKQPLKNDFHAYSLEKHLCAPLFKIKNKSETKVVDDNVIFGTAAMRTDTERGYHGRPLA